MKIKLRPDYGILLTSKLSFTHLTKVDAPEWALTGEFASVIHQQLSKPSDLAAALRHAHQQSVAALSYDEYFGQFVLAAHELAGRDLVDLTDAPAKPMLAAVPSLFSISSVSAAADHRSSGHTNELFFRFNEGTLLVFNIDFESQIFRLTGDYAQLWLVLDKFSGKLPSLPAPVPGPLAEFVSFLASSKIMPGSHDETAALRILSHAHPSPELSGGFDQEALEEVAPIFASYSEDEYFCNNIYNPESPVPFNNFDCK